jgi:hypothetical protein
MDGLTHFLESGKQFAEELKKGISDLFTRMEDNAVLSKLGSAVGDLSEAFFILSGYLADALGNLMDFLNVDADNSGLSDFVEFLETTVIKTVQTLVWLLQAAVLGILGISGAIRGLDAEEFEALMKPYVAAFARSSVDLFNGDPDSLPAEMDARVSRGELTAEQVLEERAVRKDPRVVNRVLSEEQVRKEYEQPRNAGTKPPPTSQASAMGVGAKPTVRGDSREWKSRVTRPSADTTKPAGSATQANRAASSAGTQSSTGTTKAYAEGGVVQRPTYALIGEEGPEVVINPKKPNALTLILQALQMPGLKAAVESPGLKAALSSPGLRSALDIGRRNLEMVNNAPAYMYQQIAYQNLSQNMYNMSQQQGARYNQTSNHNVANNQTDARSEEKNISLTVHNNTTIYGSGNAQEAADAVNKNNNTTLIRNLKGVLA